MRFSRTGVAAAMAASLVAARPAATQISISAQPSASVGGGDISFSLVADAAMGPRGGFLVLDRWADTVFRFDEAGNLVGIIGRRGQGPGEIGDAFAIDVTGDTLRVLDSTNGRVSTFGLDGALLHELSMRAPFVVGEGRRFSDGSWILRRQYLYEQKMGFQRDTVDYLHVDQEMAAPRRVARMAGTLGGVYPVPGDGRRHGLAAFTPAAIAATFGQCAYLTSTDEPTVVVLTSSGTAVGTYSFEGSRASRAITTARKREFVEWVAANAPPGAPPLDRAARDALLDVPRFAAELPATSGILVDPLGFVWLPDYGVGDASAAATVLVPSLDAEFRVQFPRELHLRDVGSDHLVAQVRGPLGEDIIQVYPLRRDPGWSRPPGACTAR